MASALSGIFSSSFSSCFDLERVMPAGGVGVTTSFCGDRMGDRGQGPSPGQGRAGGPGTHLPFHVDTRVVLAGVAGYEGLGDGRLAALGHVVGAVVVHEQGAQAARRDVPWEGELLLVAWVAAGQGQGCPWWPNGTAIARIPGTASASQLREQSPGEGAVFVPPVPTCA